MKKALEFWSNIRTVHQNTNRFVRLLVFIGATVFILVLLQHPASAGDCNCSAGMGNLCAIVGSNTCDPTTERASCNPSGLPGGGCAADSCTCIPKGTTCTQSPDSCTAVDPNTWCQPDGTGFSCKIKSLPTATPIPVGPGPTIEPYNPLCDPADPNSGIKSALGCLPVNSLSFTSVALPWAIYLGAGIAFLLGLYGAFLITTAGGEPEKVQAGKELITSVILGTIVIIFAVFMLEIIGVDILKLFSKI